jgi:hypothetical protein
MRLRVRRMRRHVRRFRRPRRPRCRSCPPRLYLHRRQRRHLRRRRHGRRHRPRSPRRHRSTRRLLRRLSRHQCRRCRRCRWCRPALPLRRFALRPSRRTRRTRQSPEAVPCRAPMARSLGSTPTAQRRGAATAPAHSAFVCGIDQGARGSSLASSEASASKGGGETRVQRRRGPGLGIAAKVDRVRRAVTDEASIVPRRALDRTAGRSPHRGPVRRDLA